MYNLTNANFQIERADISYSENGSLESFLMSVKFVLPDKYLFSIRSKTGIEAARIYLKGDSVFMNDRINQVYYYGKSEPLAKKWGMSVSFIPVLFGDLIVNLSQQNRIPDCLKEIVSFTTNLKGSMCNYEIDCSQKKLFSSELMAESTSTKVRLNYSQYVSSENHKYPSYIKIGFGDEKRSIEMKIRKISFDSESEIRFVPGNRYDKEVL